MLSCVCIYLGRWLAAASIPFAQAAGIALTRTGRRVWASAELGHTCLRAIDYDNIAHVSLCFTAEEGGACGIPESRLRNVRSCHLHTSLRAGNTTCVHVCSMGCCTKASVTSCLWHVIMRLLDQHLTLTSRKADVMSDLEPTSPRQQRQKLHCQWCHASFMPYPQTAPACHCAKTHFLPLRPILWLCQRQGRPHGGSAQYHDG